MIFSLGNVSLELSWVLIINNEAFHEHSWVFMFCCRVSFPMFGGSYLRCIPSTLTERKRRMLPELCWTRSTIRPFAPVTAPVECLNFFGGDCGNDYAVLPYLLQGILACNWLLGVTKFVLAFHRRLEGVNRCPQSQSYWIDGPSSPPTHRTEQSQSLTKHS